MGRRLVLEFARAPVPGRAKTRLARTEGPREAARIYRGLAERVHAVLLEAQRRGTAEVVLSPSEAGEAEEVSRWLPGAAHVWPQGAGDLGARLAEAVAHAFAAGAERVAVVGTDLSDLTTASVERAFEALDRADAAIAPAQDGGYGLIALARPLPRLFEDVPWGTDAVARTTRLRARESGIRLAELAPLHDVDVAEDLDGVVPLLSVLVPVLDEVERLPRLLESLAPPGSDDVEVVVADGGSTDGSQGLARAAGAVLVEGARGRGRQLAAAAKVARGRWLWTLHADARLDAGGLEAVLRFCRRDTRPWAFSRTRIEGAGFGLRCVENANYWRARFLKVPYGDQGILVRRRVYDDVGGYPPVALMEDVLLARRLARFGTPALLDAVLLVDRRRWERRGAWGATLENWRTLFEFTILERDPEELAARYHGRVGSTRAP